LNNLICGDNSSPPLPGDPLRYRRSYREMSFIGNHKSSGSRNAPNRFWRSRHEFLACTTIPQLPMLVQLTDYHAHFLNTMRSELLRSVAGAGEKEECCELLTCYLNGLKISPRESLHTRQEYATSIHESYCVERIILEKVICENESARHGIDDVDVRKLPRPVHHTINSHADIFRWPKDTSELGSRMPAEYTESLIDRKSIHHRDYHVCGPIHCNSSVS
jgi:hypothetical protein